MTFEEFVSRLHLPITAKELLPLVLSKQTKEKLMMHSDAEDIILSAILEIERGSIEPINELVSKHLNDMI